jgi:phosphate transport system substrate-binding protein
MPGFGVLLTNQPGKDSWPITGATFILMHKQQADAQKAKQVIDFFDWAYRNGDQLADQLHYVPMPDKVTGAVEQMWKKEIVGSDSKPVWNGPAS